MVTTSFLVLYIGLFFFQTIHIFEEIAMKVYELVGSLRKFLLAASFLVFLSYLPLILIIQDHKMGFYIALISSFIALGIGIVHLIGFIRSRSCNGTLGSGVFSGIPLGILGGIIFAQVISYL